MLTVICVLAGIFFLLRFVVLLSRQHLCQALILTRPATADWG